MPLNITSKDVECHMLADDTTLHTTSANLQEIQQTLQTGLNHVSTWCRENRMLINPLKTKAMVITTRQKHQHTDLTLNLEVNNNKIEQVKEHKLLGITVDDRLQWQAHTEKVCKTVSRNLFLLSKLQLIVDQDCRKLFYNAYIKPHIDYGSTMWDGCAEVHMKKLNSLQRRAAKLILPDPSLSTDEKLEHIDIFSLKEQHLYNKGAFMFKVFNGDVPEYILDLYSRSQSRYPNSRNDLILPRPRIDLFKNSISFSGSFLWNSLPTNITSSTSISHYKKALRRHVLATRKENHVPD
jgi:hypothetical protein